MKKSIFLLIAVLLFTVACKEDNILDEEANVVSLKVQKTNIWIKSVMDEVYLWVDKIPDGLDPTTASDSKTFFEEMIYTEEDSWSWISDNYKETMNLYEGITTTSGFDFTLSYISDNYTIIGIVEKVLPNSPADLAGIERGNIFTQLNGSELNTDNYSDILQNLGTSYSVTFATIKNNTLSYAGTKHISEVENFQENPIFIDTVYNIGGQKIAYLMYNSFVDKFNNQLNEVFAKFKSENVTDLILDLRYNGGGDGVAMNELGNLIVPPSAFGDIFLKDHYNDYVEQNYFSTEEMVSRFTENANNINLPGKICALVSSNTASASEGVLNGLKPFMDIKLIGTPTHGKYTGMWVIADDNEEWVIIPIVVKTTNKNDESVKGGMLPDLEVSDYPLDGYQLGQIEETMLAQALSEITNVVLAMKSTPIKQEISTTKIASFNGRHKREAIPLIYDTPERLIENR